MLYGEVGIATRLAVVADFVLLRSLTLARAGENASAIGIGDLRAGFRLLLLDEEVTCALEAKLGIPTGRSDATLPLGTGDLRGEFALSLGHVWERVPIYFTVDLGAVLRGSGSQRVTVPGPGQAGTTTTTIDYASELTYDVELGYLVHVGSRVRLSPRVRLEGRYGLRAPIEPLAPDASPNLVAAPIAPESVRYVRIGAALGTEIALPKHDSGRGHNGGPINYLLLDAGGGAFVWGEGLPAAYQVSFAVGWKR